MTTTVQLAPGGRTDATAGVLQVDWRVPGGTPGEVEVVVEDEGGAPAPGVQRLYDGRLVVLVLPGPVVLRAVPRGGGVAAAGTRLAVTLTVQQQATAVTHVVLPERDVSATARDEQARITPVGPGAWRIDAAGESSVAGNDLPEDPMALRAAYAARRVVGAPRAPEPARRDVVVVLDLTASMLPHLRSGAVQALLAVTVGLAAVVGRTSVLPVWTSGRHPLRLADLSDGTLPGHAERALAEHGVGLGGSVGTLMAGPLRGAGPETAVVHLADAVPPDLSAAGRDPAWAGSWHLLALARSAAHGAAGIPPWQDELRALPAGPLASSAAALPPVDDLTAHLSDDAVLDGLVTRLALTGGAR